MVLLGLSAGLASGTASATDNAPGEPEILLPSILPTTLPAAVLQRPPAWHPVPASPGGVCLPSGVGCGLQGPLHALTVGGSGTALLLGSAALGIAGGMQLPHWQFQTQGRPDPLVTTLGMGVGFGVGVAASQLLVPLAAHLGGGKGGVARARAAGWERSRWAVLAGGVGLATMTAGSMMERRDFGSGQAVMAAGAGTLVLSALAYVGLELAGVVDGSWQARW